MKQSKAIKHLQHLQTATIKMRSVLAEDGIIVKDKTPGLVEIDEYFASGIWPWVWGKKCILPILTKILDNCEETGTLAPMDFYNQIVIASQLEPLLANMTNIYLVTQGAAPDFPEEPNIHWMKGWDPE